MKTQEESGVVEDLFGKTIPIVILPLSYPNTHFLSNGRQKPGTFSLPKKAKTFIYQDFYI
ncbi:hypothetical protein [Okeania sp. SIO3B5]|uniref:hypothetical protein n=1 Tax=Okeania sp. SIO3B5 TaxID=2607811 RepID=UPI0025CED926|nr:hypothetical protein [Okeania sp. SIO3B5]